jgi:hypothetical protein
VDYGFFKALIPDWKIPGFDRRVSDQARQTPGAYQRSYPLAAL